MNKKIIKISIISVILVFILSIAIQFVYNMKCIDIYEAEMVKGGDSPLNRMLYESPNLPDSYFNDDEQISQNLEGAIERIDVRDDCCDFTANHLIRFYLENKDRLKEKNKEEIRRCLTGLKYWLTDYDGKDDSMCFWSENHQILFAVTEYLTGNEWPNVKFADNRTGASHVISAKERINAWMEQRYYYGFNEYYSNNYYIEDIGPMSNFIEFASSEDSDMVNRMMIVMDILWYDIASQSYRYVDETGKINYAFMSASGRMYMDNKSSDDTGNRLRLFIDYVLDNGEEYKTYDRNFFVCFKRMYENTSYEVPQVIKNIFNDDKNVQIVKSSNGITLEELEDDGFIGKTANQIMMQMGMEAFTNENVINNSIDLLKKYKLFGNEFLNDFKLVNLCPLTTFNLLDEVSNLVNPSTNGKAIQRSNVYTYQTGFYSMSTNQAHFAGDYADQHQINLTTISSDITVYTAQPMRKSTRGQYWVGYGRLPYSVQDTNVNISIYDIPQKTGFLEPHIVKYTHAYFPLGLFDEYNLDYLSQGYIFGRKNDTYITLIAKSNGESTLRFKNDFPNITQEEINSDLKAIKTNVKEMIEASNDLRYDLILEGGTNHAWITELSSINEDGNFQSFISRILSNDASYQNMNVKYNSNNKSYDVLYDKYFKLNNQEVDMEYDRFESDYVLDNVERKSDVIVFSYYGNTLELDYKNNKRVVK